MTKARSLSDFIESDGSVTLVDNQKIKVGTDNDLEIYHDGNHSHVADVGTGGLKLTGGDIYIRNPADQDMIYATSGGAVTLYHNNSAKLATTSTGVNVTGHITASGTNNIYVGDNGKFVAGGGDDLQIYHDGSNSFIKNNTGILNIVNNDIRFKTSGDETTLRAVANGAVELMFDNSTKLATNSGGVSVTGDILSANNNTDDTNKEGHFLARQYDSGTETEGFQILQYFSNSSENRVDLGGASSAYNAATSINFYTAANTITRTGTTRMTIDSSGRVGIGTSSPAFENGNGLEIRNSSGNGSHLKLTDNASGTGATQGFDLYMFNSQAYIENYENAPTIFRNNGAQRMSINSSGNVQISSGGVGSADGALSVIGTSATGDMITRFEYSGNDNDVKGIRVNAPNTSGTQTYADISVDPEAYEVGISVAQSGGGLAIGNSDHSNAELVVTNQRIVNGATKTYTYLNTDVVEANKSGGRISACVQDEFHIGGEKYFNSRYHDSPSVTRTYYDGGSSGYAGYGYPGNSTYIPNIYIPYSPTQVYSLSATIYQHTGNANHYMGVIGYDENFNAVYVDGIGTYQYILASNSYLAQGNFLKTQNAISNWQGSGQTDGNKMDEGTVYLRPMLLLNYAASTTKLAIVCGFTIQASGVSNTLLHTLSAGTDY